MKRLIVATLALCFSVAFTGCDEIDGSSSSKGHAGLQEEICTVLSKTYLPLSTDDVAYYDCSGNKRIVATTKTGIVTQRGSCSGFEAGNFQTIDIGDTLVVRYSKNDIDYTTRPNIIRAQTIEAYDPNCLGVTNSSQVGGTCPDTCDFFN